MAKFYDCLNADLMDFIRAQHVFFTGTAADQGRINVSPKGLSSLRILDARQIMRMDIESLQTSCGWGVPRYNFNGERDTLVEWANKKGEAALAQYRQEKIA